MKILFIIKVSPWGSSLAATAFRLARAALDDGDQLLAVYFRADGVYHAFAGDQADAGTPELTSAWTGLAETRETPLLLCSAAVSRRYPPHLSDAIETPFQQAGLARLLELMAASERVVTF